MYMTSKMGNPGVFGLASLGFALTVLGFQFVAPHEGTGGATTYAVLVAAIGESLAGLLSIPRGDTWFGAVLCTFGAWLFGYFFLITSDPSKGLLTAKSNGLFILFLIIPLAYYTLPALRLRMVTLSACFIGIALALAFLGFGSYFGKTSLGTVGGWLSLASAAITFYISHQTLSESFAGEEPEPASSHVVASGSTEAAQLA